MSRAEEAKGWRSSVMNPAQTPNTEPDRSQRNASTSTGEATHARTHARAHTHTHTHTNTCTHKRSCFFHGLHHPPASVPAISYYWLQLTPLCMQHSSTHRSLPSKNSFSLPIGLQAESHISISVRQKITYTFSLLSSHAVNMHTHTLIVIACFRVFLTLSPYKDKTHTHTHTHTHLVIRCCCE